MAAMFEQLGLIGCGLMGGSFALASSPSALTEIYDELGFQLSNEYLLRYRSAAQPDENVAVEVAVPSELSDDQRAAIEQLAAATTVNPRSALT